MKKRLMTGLLACAMTLSFLTPVIASDVSAIVPITAENQESNVVPFNEQTQLVFQWFDGVLYFRVWSLTNGRWLTDWVPFIPA